MTQGYYVTVDNRALCLLCDAELCREVNSQPTEHDLEDCVGILVARVDELKNVVRILRKEIRGDEE